VDIDSHSAFPGPPCEIWYHVPGQGMVNWDVERLTEHARYLVGLHRPHRRLPRRASRYAMLPWLTGGWLGCEFCNSRRTCRESEWARDWLGAATAGQLMSNGGAPAPV
jgi:hypothetical protein